MKPLRIISVMIWNAKKMKTATRAGLKLVRLETGPRGTVMATSRLVDKGKFVNTLQMDSTNVTMMKLIMKAIISISTISGLIMRKKYIAKTT